MRTFDDLGLQEIKSLFSKKKDYIVNNNFEGLMDLKKNYPFLFDPQQEAEFNKLLEYIHGFSNLPHIQHQLREQQKSRLIEVNVDEWNLEEYEKLLITIPVVNVSNIKELSRALVRNSILISKHIFLDIHIDDSNKIFACVGFLLGEILNLIDIEERRLKHLNTIIRMLTKNLSFYNDEEKSSSIPIEIKQTIKEKFRNQCLKLFFKFDKRIEFKNDIIFFCLVEVSEYITLLKPLFSEVNNSRLTRKIVANMIELIDI